MIYLQWKALSNFWTTGVSYQWNQSHCPLDRVIHIFWTTGPTRVVQATLFWCGCLVPWRHSLNENLRAKEDGRWKRASTSLLYPSHGLLRSSPVTRVSHSPASMRNQLMWHKIMTSNRFSLNWVLWFSPCFRMQTYSCLNSRCHLREGGLNWTSKVCILRRVYPFRHKYQHFHYS